MSTRDVEQAEDALTKAVMAAFPLTSFGPGVKEAYELRINGLVEAISDLAKIIADDRIDRDQRRGEHSYD